MGERVARRWWIPLLVVAGLAGMGMGCAGGEQVSPFTDALVVMREGTKLRMAPAEFGGVVDQLPLGTDVLAVPEDAEVSYDAAWAEVELADGRTGFIERIYLGPPSEWQQVVALRDSIAGAQPQATGTLATRANLRLEPHRGGRILDAVAGGTPFEMFLRVATMKGEDKEIWYLVDLGQGRVGYVFTRQLDVDPPRDLPPHTRYRRMVAWRQMGGDAEHPTVVVGSIGDGDLGCDFDRVEVYAWDAGAGGYGTMFSRRDLRGILPIETAEVDGRWTFTVRQLTDDGVEATVWSDTRPARVLETRHEPPSPYLH